MKEHDKQTTTSEHGDGSAVVEGILNEARSEAERLITQAEQSAAQRKAAFTKQKQRELEEAEREAKKRAEEVLSAARSRREIELRRRKLLLQERLSNQILQQASRTIEKMLESKEYLQVLQDLLTEAAIGIRTEEAEVNASARERELITQSLLTDVQRQVEDISGRHISLKQSTNQPLSAQGVVLTSPDGSVAFSNQIPDRMRRYQSEIRHLIYSQLFDESRTEGA
ncbi:MAG: V-type ATP synthase subunit E [Spirochaetota bacterium]